MKRVEDVHSSLFERNNVYTNKIPVGENELNCIFGREQRPGVPERTLHLHYIVDGVLERITILTSVDFQGKQRHRLDNPVVE